MELAKTLVKTGNFNFPNSSVYFVKQMFKDAPVKMKCLKQVVQTF